jgi:osmotically-inducible protein OsmY
VNGIVTLTGVVETEGQKAEAEKLTRQTDGVLGVTNQLRIK